MFQLSISFPNLDRPSGGFQGFFVQPSGEIDHSLLDNSPHMSQQPCWATILSLFCCTRLLSRPYGSHLISVQKPGGSSSHSNNAVDAIQHNMNRMANMKAVEIWLGTLNLLKDLKNMECAILNIRSRTDDSVITLRPRYAAIVENWRMILSLDCTLLSRKSQTAALLGGTLCRNSSLSKLFSSSVIVRQIELCVY